MGCLRSESGMSRDQRELVEDVGTFICSLVAISVYFMCALVGAPFWSFVWLLVIPLWQGVKFILPSLPEGEGT